MKKLSRPEYLLAISGLLIAALNASAYWAVFRLNFLSASQDFRQAITAGIFSSLSVVIFGLIWRHRQAILAGGPRVIAIIGIVSVLLFSTAVAAPLAGVPDNYWNTLMSRAYVIYGLNPYRIFPQLMPNDALFPMTAHEWRNDTMHYGPVWVLAAALPVLVTHDPAAELVGMKILLVAAYVGGGLLLWAALRRRARLLGSTRDAQADLFLAVWLWNPAAVFEIGNSAHNDGLLIFFLCIFAVGLLRGKPQWALPSLALAVMTKYWPVVLVSALFGLRGARRREWLRGAAAAFVVLCLPLLFGGWSAVLPGVIRQSNLISPRYYSPLIFWLWQSLVAFGRNPLESFYPARIAGGVFFLSAAALSAFLLYRRKISSLTAAGLTALAFLVAVMGWLQPWYLLAVLPLALRPERPDWGEEYASLAALAAVSGFLAYRISWGWVALLPLAAILYFRKSDKSRLERLTSFCCRIKL